MHLQYVLVKVRARTGAGIVVESRAVMRIAWLTRLARV